MRAIVPIVLGAAGVFLVGISLWVGGGNDHRHKPPKDTTALADRINTACKSGFKVMDWTVGDEFDPLPPGTVQVTCVRVKSPYDLYTVAVAR